MTAGHFENSTKSTKILTRKLVGRCSVLVQEDADEAVERLTEKMLDGILEAYSLCFFSVQPNTQAMFRQVLKEERLQLMRVTFQKLSKCVQEDERGLHLTFSIVEARKECIKDLLKVSQNDQTPYESSESCRNLSHLRVYEFQEILKALDKVQRIQDKFEQINYSTILRLTVCETSSEVSICHVYFIDLAYCSSDFLIDPDDGVLPLVSRLLHNKEISNKNKIVNFIEGSLIETSKISLTYYSSLSLINRDEGLLNEISKIRLHSTTINNEHPMSESTEETLAKINQEISVIRQKIEDQNKKFRERISQIQRALNIHLNLSELEETGLTQEDASKLKKFKEAYDRLNTIMKVVGEQKNKIKNIQDELKKKKKQTQRRDIEFCRSLRNIREEIKKLENQKKSILFRIQKKQDDIRQKENSILSRMKHGRLEALAECKKYVKKVQSVRKIPRQHTTITLSPKKSQKSSDTYLKSYEQKCQEELQKLRSELQRLNTCQQPIDTEILAEMYRNYTRNNDLIRKVNKNHIYSLTVRRQYDNLDRISQEDLPLIFQQSGNTFGDIQTLRQQLSQFI